MPKRKVFAVSDISAPRVEHKISPEGKVIILPDTVPPVTTRVLISDINGRTAYREFKQWYGLEIDALVYACQLQIERFVAKQDAEVEPSTVVTYADRLGDFFDYAVMYASSLGRKITLDDVDRQFIDGYLGFLGSGKTSTSSQKSAYHSVKAVLKALCRRGLIRETLTGDERTFPANPFPGVQHKTKSAKPLSKQEKKNVVLALRSAISPLFQDGVVVTSELLSYALLFVAIHTGRNTTPLLEMGLDALRPHPKDNTMFLVLYKRRGHSTSKVALKHSREETLNIESLGAIRPTVVRVIQRVIELTACLRTTSHPSIKGLVWIYPMQNAALGQPGGGPGALPRPGRRQGPGLGQTGAGNCRCRRPQPADGRPAGFGQIDAGTAFRRPAAANDAGRSAGERRHRQPGRAFLNRPLGGARRRFTTPLGQRGGAGGWWL